MLYHSWSLLCKYLVQPVCTFFLHIPAYIIIYEVHIITVLHIILLHILFSILFFSIFYFLFLLYLIFFHTYIYVYSLVFVFNLNAQSMEQTWLTFHCWLYSV